MEGFGEPSMSRVWRLSGFGKHLRTFESGNVSPSKDGNCATSAFLRPVERVRTLGAGNYTSKDGLIASRRVFRPVERVRTPGQVQPHHRKVDQLRLRWFCIPSGCVFLSKKACGSPSSDPGFFHGYSWRACTILRT